jgi:glycosyltransferase involved in cell wall biosynthesis
MAQQVDELKIIHVPFTFPPDPSGGTEVYVERLSHSLRAHRVQSVIAAPSVNGADWAYEHNGLSVRRFRSAVTSKHMLRELYGRGDPEAAAAFAKLLDEERPDLVHMHSFTRAASVLLVRAAKERHLPVVLTYHTPTMSCPRGTLMFRDEEQCDGLLDVRRCTACYGQALGVPYHAGALLNRMPFLIARGLEKSNLSGGIWTALRLPQLLRIQYLAFQELLREVSQIVALSEWSKAVLIRNGVPSWKIAFSRHGAPSLKLNSDLRVDPADTPLRAAFLGRIDRSKGAAVLLEALRLIPDAPIEFHFYGISQSAADEEHWNSLQLTASANARVKFFKPVPHDRIISLLMNYHILAVPSRGLETGPLIIPEAFAAGTPVIGSNLGGIAEWVQHEHNGLLIDHRDASAWANALRRCAEDRVFLASLQANAKVSRSMDDAAREMAQLYRRHSHGQSQTMVEAFSS